MTQDFERNEAAVRAGEPPRFPDTEPNRGTAEVHATVPPCPEEEDVSAETAPALREPDPADAAADGDAPGATPADEFAATRQRAD